MPNPIHRIEPRLLTVPQFYGSPGEPTLGRMPTPSMPQMRGPQQGPSMGGMIPLAALASMMGRSGGAQSPGMEQVPLDQIAPETPNDEALDMMPDELSFSKAFAKARKMGLVEFTWRGKQYTTKLK